MGSGSRGRKVSGGGGVGGGDDDGDSGRTRNQSARFRCRVDPSAGTSAGAIGGNWGGFAGASGAWAGVNDMI